MNISSILKYTGGLALAVVSGAIKTDTQDNYNQQTHHNNTHRDTTNAKHKAYGETYEKRFKNT